MNLPVRKFFYLALLIIILPGIYFILINSGLADLFSKLNLLIIKVRDLGVFGPLLIIGLMILAIVFNPLPSAPIALAAGAVYGHSIGTIYIVVGASTGAIVAFIIARKVGYELASKYLGDNLPLGRFGSQNAMTAVVFTTRLIPFMSFDLVSYAAGLTSIKLWRFALATILGLMPVSFALAHLGSEIVNTDTDNLVLIILAVGLLTLVPLILNALHQSFQHNKLDKQERQ